MDKPVIVTLPKLGESIHEAQIVKWLKKEGAFVKQNEPIVEVLTDKVASEIPAPSSGFLQTITAMEGSTCNVGDTLCLLSGEKKDSFYSPVILQIAKEKGVSLEVLETIPRTGAEGRLTKKDLEHYLLSHKEIKSSMSPIRKTISHHMTLSHQEIPAAYFITEVDVTHLEKKIAEERKKEQKAFTKTTITAYVAKAIGSAASHYPLMQTMVENGEMIQKDRFNLGIAMNVEGDLYVPVIHNINGLSPEEIALNIQLLKQKALQKSLEIADVNGASMTLSNFGMSSIDMGVPIIPYKQVGIIAIGASKKKPIVLDNEEIVIRSCLYMTLAFDHRVVDGMYAAAFLEQIIKSLS